MMNEELDMKLFFTTAQRSFFWIFLFLLIAVTASFIKLRYTAPIYESASVIKIGIEDNANKVLNLSSGMAGGGSSSQFISGEIEFMRSETFIEKILADVPLGIS